MVLEGLVYLNKADSKHQQASASLIRDSMNLSLNVNQEVSTHLVWASTSLKKLHANLNKNQSQEWPTGFHWASTSHHLTTRDSQRASFKSEPGRRLIKHSWSIIWPTVESKTRTIWRPYYNTKLHESFICTRRKITKRRSIVYESFINYAWYTKRQVLLLYITILSFSSLTSSSVII